MKNRIFYKMIAILLIFTLTSANFLFVGQSFAVSLDDLFGTSTTTNVEFDAYFNTEANDKAVSVISDVNNDNLAINLTLSVKDSGYLKDAKIKIEGEPNKELNFVLGELSLENSLIQSFEDNEISLKQIDANIQADISVPITYKSEKFVNEDMFSEGAMLVLNGTYVDSEGKDIPVSYEKDLKLSWTNSQEVKVDSDLEKYVDYGDGVILQTSIKIDGTTDEKTLPIRETNLDIEVPSLDDKKPTSVTVVANKTENTNGQDASNLAFDESNWNYSDDTLKIKIDNNKKMVSYEEYAEDYLVEQDQIKAEERYYNQSGIDEFLVTYVYEGATVGDINEVVSNVSTKIATYGSEDDKNVTTATNEFTYNLDEQVGDLVSLNIDMSKNEISKSGIYSNCSNKEKTEIEFDSNEVLNISSKDIIESLTLRDVVNSYVSKENVETAMSDIYVKKVSIQADNFKSILGDEGYIKLFDNSGNEISEIRSDNESESYSYDYTSNDNKLILETSKPIAEGNLVLSVKRAMQDTSMSKEAIKNMAEIKTRVEALAKYQYVQGKTIIGDSEAVTKLNDTVSKVNLLINKDTLSTLSLNENVEFKLELNNNNDWSDIFGDSSFDIKLPENIENVEIKDANIIYGEGLELANTEVVDGNTIRATLSGLQSGLNSSVLTNGTNIIINADLKVNEFTPLKSDDVELEFTNSEATNYSEEENKVDIVYSAPRGLVSVNTISGYKDGASVTSVSQGSKSEMMDVHADAKDAKMQLYMMNNTGENVSNVKVLGRFPYKDMIDIVTDSKLGSGTTVDASLTSGINGDEGFKVYYSENEKATAELEKNENAWNEEVEDISKMKSFLIVPEDENYELQSGSTLNFEYGFEIPADLPHGEVLASTYATYYTSHENGVKMDHMSFPDIVELTTGEGPELGLSLNIDRDIVREYEEFPISVVVKNIGKEKAEDIVLEMPIPAGATYVSNEVVGEDTDATAIVEDGKLKLTASSIELNREIAVNMNLKANEIPSEEGKINTTAKVDAKELGTTVTAQKDVKVESAEIAIEEYETSAHPYGNKVNVGDNISVVIKVKNLTDKSLNNLTVIKELTENFEVVRAEAMDVTTTNTKKIADGKVEGNKITWNIDQVEAGKTVFICYDVKVLSIVNNLTSQIAKTSVKAFADGTEIYETNKDIDIASTVLAIRQSTDTSVNSVVTEDEHIKYLFEIENGSDIDLRDIVFRDSVPDTMRIESVKYSYEGNDYHNDVYSGSEVVIPISNLSKGNIANIEIECVPKITTEAYEKTITNVASVKTSNIDELISNPITHIVRITKTSAFDLDKESSEDAENDSNGSVNASNTNAINRTYKISGYVWEDKNKDGVRENGEKPIVSDIQVKLVESETGTIIKTVSPNGAGLYELNGIKNGTYFVLYDYDTVKYGITNYHKEGVAAEVNSDAVQTKITQNGKVRNAAVSDKIVVDNASISNIDIGLFEADKFDLSLEMGITKVTVQSKNGTTTNSYNAEKLVKEDIAAKHLAGSVVYVEYEIKVQNSGDLAGYAKKIKDYKPADMEFNSSLSGNENWYLTADGILYSTALQDKELAKGETATIKLILTKKMTEENTGLVNNIAEIEEDYNIYGVSDYNSTPANKAQGENDISSSDIILLIKTGETLIYTSVLITTAMIIGIGAVVISKKIAEQKKKGGV